jgi:hypothetical protein
MNKKQAKEIIARRLVGYPIRVEHLEEACRILKEDRAYMQHLAEILGIVETKKNACETFQAHLSEFVNMAQDKLRSTMRDIWDHLVSCKKCCRLYWDTRSSYWEPTDEAGCVTIPFPIQLRFDHSGPVEQFGAGPPPGKAIYKVAGTHMDRSELREGDLQMYGIPTEVEDSWLWEIPDKETKCIITFGFKEDNDQQVQLMCRVDRLEDSWLHDQTVEMQIFKEGKLESIPEDEREVKDLVMLPLEQGVWIIQFYVKSGKRRIWRIQVELKPHSKY